MSKGEDTDRHTWKSSNLEIMNASALYAHTYTCIYTYLYTHIYTQVHVTTYMYMHVHRHTHPHKYAQRGDICNHFDMAIHSNRLY